MEKLVGYRFLIHRAHGALGTANGHHLDGFDASMPLVDPEDLTCLPSSIPHSTRSLTSSRSQIHTQRENREAVSPAACTPSPTGKAATPLNGLNLFSEVGVEPEIISGKSLEGKERLLYEKKRKIREALEEGKPIPTELRNEEAALRQEIDLEDENTAVPRPTIDDEYANAADRDPKILLTTSRNPSAPLTQFVKELKFVFPNAQRMNRGAQELKDLVEDVFRYTYGDGGEAISDGCNTATSGVRHHIYEKRGGPKSIELKEIGPRFEMRLYQLKLGTVDQDEAQNEWVIRPYMNTAKKRMFLGD
ncbi:unnamed protein product [Fraxinus pennsylvanica]|uniref:Brix domain-containing protein n=1 Tax=Fraxinus pennsylvanica TaxID=56036 RepID=A0AAD1Z787_9LAMI|nr:unnamed protein product [Fraxinus pennsylvanica]